MTGRILPQVVSGTAGWTGRSRGRAGLWERPRVQSGHVGNGGNFSIPKTKQVRSRFWAGERAVWVRHLTKKEGSWH